MVFDSRHMRIWKTILPVLAMLVAFGFANAEEKKATLSYYYFDG